MLIIGLLLAIGVLEAAGLFEFVSGIGITIKVAYHQANNLLLKPRKYLHAFPAAN